MVAGGGAVSTAAPRRAVEMDAATRTASWCCSTPVPAGQEAEARQAVTVLEQRAANPVAASGTAAYRRAL